MSLPPPSGLNNWMGQKKAKKSKAQVIDEISRIKDSSGQAVEMLKKGQIIEDTLPYSTSWITNPAQNPEKKKSAESQDGGHNLVFSNWRPENSQSLDSCSHQKQAEVAKEKWNCLRVAVDKGKQCRNRTQKEHDKKNYQGSQIFADDYLGDWQRWGK